MRKILKNANQNQMGRTALYNLANANPSVLSEYDDFNF
jgi:hypothetical protein